jgi:hypothetical protein
MSTDLIVRKPESLEVTFSPEAYQMREGALADAAMIAVVDNADKNSLANAALERLGTLRKLAEKARVAAKEPYLEAGRYVDAQHKAFVEDIKTEEWRVSQLIGGFFEIQEAKRKAAEQAARMEAERIAAEQRAEQERILREQVARENAERLEREAANRKIQEAERAAAEANNAEQRKAAEAARAEAELQRIAIQRLQERAAADTHAQLDAANDRAAERREAIAVAAPEPVRAAGQTVKQEWDVTVSDIHKLYKFHPNCVALEPRLSEIKSLLAAGATVQGVTAKQVMKAGVRTGRAPLAIDI